MLTTRLHMLYTISLTLFIINENLYSTLQDYKHDINYIYSSINNSKSLIDYFLVSVIYTLNGGVCKANVIPGWDYEADCAREESLLSQRIWIESGKPDRGIEYNNTKRCKASYHYLLRYLKSRKDVHVKQSVSKSLFRSSKRNYWKSVLCYSQEE